MHIRTLAKQVQACSKFIWDNQLCGAATKTHKSQVWHACSGSTCSAEKCCVIFHLVHTRDQSDDNLVLVRPDFGSKCSARRALGVRAVKFESVRNHNGARIAIPKGLVLCCTLCRVVHNCVRVRRKHTTTVDDGLGEEAFL